MGGDAEATWTKRVERWGTSGLTAKEFAAKTGLNAWTLTYWKWRLGRGASGQARKKVEFVQVVPPGPPPPMPHDAFEVVLGNGVEVRAPVWFDADALRRLVATIGRRVMLPRTVRVLACTTPQDMRRSFDRLALMAKESLGDDRGGAVLVPVEEARVHASEQSSKNVDATGWRQAGQARTLWTIATSLGTVFGIVADASRAGLRPSVIAAIVSPPAS